ncbi:hypothetical protein C2845_PM02G33410 [Panicum miliaceum]|uniref:Uncharacterized protein n=1 Tax=Panicum miliaceum TaxID=4540 RepID=A0A3L6SD71_PANMI|nr:hypothetical protein C2845_PM02G33410 [Panicum miliaceum]
MDVAKGKETGNTESDIGMTLGARGNPTDVTGNKEIVRDNYEGIAKVLDLTGGKETDRVNDCIAVLGTPDSNPVSSCSAPAASRLNGCRSLDSANKSTFSLEDSACQPADRSSASSDLMLDIPPGFSIDVPPGFTKAHCKLQMEAAAVSCADARPSLILDALSGFPTDIPPGFTEAHRRLPAAISSAGPEAFASTTGTKKKPLIRFSLNVPKPIKMEVPPGFTALHAVKQEPGLPAIDKATENRMLYSLASGASSIGKAGKEDEMEIMHNEVQVAPVF